MKKYKVLWSEPAIHDFENILDYIANDNKLIAKNILERVEKRTSELEEMPQRGSNVSELDEFNLYNYKQLIEYPWRIIYRIDDDLVYILAIIDGRRKLDEILRKRTNQPDDQID